MDKVRLTLNKDEATIVEGDESFVGQIIAAGQKGIRINNPLLRREIHKVKDHTGKVLKDDLHPENVGKVEKPKQTRGKPK